MVKHASNPKSLFFHMGPGFHAKIEAHQFQASFPQVAFLDQPPCIRFSELVAWTRSQVLEHAQKSSEKLTLLGFSFGAQLIAAVLPEVSEHIAQVRFLNSAFDPLDCFANLEEKLRPQAARGRAWWKTQDTPAKMALILSLASEAGFADAYWQSSSAQQSYNKVAGQYPPLDVEVFIHVFTDYLEQKPFQNFKSWAGPMQIYYSPDDALIQTPEVVKPWLQIYPQAQLVDVPGAGHHALFESPSLTQDFFK